MMEHEWRQWDHSDPDSVSCVHCGAELNERKQCPPEACRHLEADFEVRAAGRLLSRTHWVECGRCGEAVESSDAYRWLADEMTEHPDL